MRRCNFYLIILALVGLLLNISVHINVLLSPAFAALPIYHLLMFISLIGLFVVWIPAVFSMNELTSRGRKRRDPWKVAFQALPSWAKFLVWVLIIYGFALGGIQSSMRVRNIHNFQHSQEWIVWKPRVESGQYIPFYCVAAAILYTRWRR